jgi:hypothetical protein
MSSDYQIKLTYHIKADTSLGVLRIVAATGSGPYRFALPGPHLSVANGGSAFDDDGVMIDLPGRLGSLVASFAGWIRLVGTDLT